MAKPKYQSDQEYRSMKKSSSTKKGRGRSKGEIKREQSKSYLAYDEQRQKHNFGHEC